MTGKIPWWAKIGLKVIWSRLPIPYGLWKRVGLFRHGSMDSADYVANVFHRHWDRSQFARKGGGFCAMELGCGDSLASSLMARSVGASRCYLVDVGRFAATDMNTYRRIASALSKSNPAIPDISACASTGAMLTALNTEYLTEGLRSLKTIPDKSVDFIWSEAVLEHVKRNEFAETFRELRRILRDDGVTSHQIDLRDHLGRALNNLRFRDEVWEGPLMAKSGFYTNRIQFTEMLGIMKSAGFDIEFVEATRWDVLPTPRGALAERFRQLSDDELRVKILDVVLRPA
jgi:SAM-dependent methyltransferase